MKLLVKDVMEAAGISLPAPQQIAGHEDNIGENMFVPLMAHAGYDVPGDLFRKPTLSHAIVGQSRAPDFGILRYQDEPRQLFGMVADVKGTGVVLTPKLEEKLAGYCGLAGASFGILMNDVEMVILRPKNGVVDWDYLGEIPAKHELLQKVHKRPTQYSEPHIIYATRITEEITESTVETLAKRCHEIIRSRKGMAVPDRLYEFSKLLLTRIMDERAFAEKRQNVLHLTTTELDDLQSRNVDLSAHVNKLFHAVKADVGIFKAKETIDLPIDVIQQMVQMLDQFPMWSREIDVLGQVYEKFLVKTMTGQELGQFFTPRPIVQTIVSMVDPGRGQSILDPACGSGGFLINSLMYMKQKYQARTAKEIRALAQRIRGVDIFETATKLCQINLFLHGDCHDNVVRCDSLDADGFPDFMMEALKHPEKDGLDCIVTNPPFGAKEGTRLDSEWSEKLTQRWQRRGVKMFECAVAGSRYRDLQPQSPFVELCIKLLKRPRIPGGGGRLGIVVDNGLLSNVQKEEPAIRSIIRRECIIEAIVGMPKGTFKPYGSNVIPDFLILRRKHPTETQGPVFRAEVLKIGLMPGMGSYKEASDADLKQTLTAWRRWRGVEGVANESA
jgi:type I restriction-modification system DNA methylase subunit